MKRVNRRAFLKEGLATAVMSPFAVREAMAQARKVGKRGLNEATVNRLCANSSEQDYRAMCLEALKDFKAFVRKTFFLTPDQDAALNELTADQVTTFQAAISRTQQNKARFQMRVKYGSSAGKKAKENVQEVIEETRESSSGALWGSGEGKVITVSTKSVSPS